MEIFANLPEKMKESQSSVISRFPSKDPSNDSLESRRDANEERVGYDYRR